MSKINAIRKKALNLVRKQDWTAAVKEYNRLAELDQSNPNVYNELGDIHLKTGDRTSAYDSFVKAIDAYARVSLHNNAVAVCKKVLRVIPARFEVLARLGHIRHKQGLVREAESYYDSYLKKLCVEPPSDTKETAEHCNQIAQNMVHSVPMLQSVADCLIQYNLKDEAAVVLTRLHTVFSGEGNTTAADGIRRKLEGLGMAELLGAGSPDDSPDAQEGPVITEDNLWTDAHTEGERMAVDAQPQADSGQAVPMAGAPAAAAPPSEPVFESGEVDALGSVPEGVATATTQAPAAPAPPADQPGSAPRPEGAGEPTAEEFGPGPAQSDDLPPLDDPLEPRAQSGDAESIHVSAIIDKASAETAGEVGESDFRSHYDLGMAYLEMELHPEAIREFQFATQSPQYRIKSLEMIGLCFLKQGQASLAIKQLTMGLTLIGRDDREALGIKYNLGLAYEMIGDTDQAKQYFEDVYVVDITFRDVAEKISRLG